MDKPPSYEDVCAIRDHIFTKTNCRPTVAVICGSGLGSLSEAVLKPEVIEYADIPGFPVSTVPGHVGQLVFGEIAGQKVVLMQGRCHLYEGYPAWKVVVPIRTLALLGAKTMIVTNAAGGVNQSYSVGDIMVIKDHISFPCFSAHNPLMGGNDDRWGPRFPPMSDAYDRSLRILAKDSAKELEFESFVREGVYCQLTGPSYETIAECKALATLGVDATGMSTVPEVIAARHCGLRVLGMSMITNKVVLDYDSNEKANHEEVLEAGRKRAKDLVKLVERFLSKL